MILNIEVKSDLFDSGSSIMAPNSEESPRMAHCSFTDEMVSREKLRPPIYNPEDYAIMLKKWGKKSPNGGMVSLYSSSSTSDIACNRSQSNNSFRDYRNPMMTSSSSEMTLRQFGTVSELLAKLKSDLRLAFPSFIQEFVADPLDGVTLLLDLLRAIQLSQSNTQPGSTGTAGKVPPSLQRRALLDELSCLQCLLSCCMRYTEAVRKLTASSAGLFTLAICIMSNVNKSRITALLLLCKACEPPTNGHSSVSEAMSTLRLRFGEPVRFRFLVGMLTSASGQKELLASGIKFLNKFLDSAGSAQKRLYVQAELEQAGFDVAVIKKNIGNAVADCDQILEELDHWEKNHIDVESLMSQLANCKKENDGLRDKVLLLERKVQILQEEKGILVSLEQCLKDRCSELQGEVRSLKSEVSPKGTFSKKKDDQTANEDEGISSSERSPTPDEAEIQRESSYEVFSTQRSTVPNSKPLEDDEEEEETTIDEVIEELRNIINDAETEDFAMQQRKKKEHERTRIEEAQVASKLQVARGEVADYAVASETEIIPSNLHPQPPRKARSLVHLFMPTEDYYCCNKELFFENETAYTSEDGSDSLLSASKCHKEILPAPPPPSKNKVKTYDRKLKRASSKASVKRSESFRRLAKVMTTDNSFDGSYYYSTPVKDFQQKEKQKVMQELSNHRIKCKSLDRIDDGLDSMIDIVVTAHKGSSNDPKELRTKSDSGNVTATTLARSVSNVVVMPKREARSKLSTHSEDKQKMFLPSQREHGEAPYYFPRVQERIMSNSNSFLIKRGHANAGLYSGQILCEGNGLIKSKEYISTSNCRLSGKVTDYPSGLY